MGDLINLSDLWIAEAKCPVFGLLTGVIVLRRVLEPRKKVRPKWVRRPIKRWFGVLFYSS